MTLPPIAYLERLLTPPDDSPYVVDWLDFTRSRSARFIAEKTCEMICYLWFSTPDIKTNPLQLHATEGFVSFMQKLLETTQVSHSVIVLSLHFIHRLKTKNPCPAQQGSEFRIAVAGLMMANKFLDDNTYTNKTWAEVSGIDLHEINRMEREFLAGVDFNLYVDKPTYESWLNLLKGLVQAKEKDARHFRKSHQTRLPAASSRVSSHASPPRRSYSRQRHAAYNHRARSTSPDSRPASKLELHCPVPVVPAHPSTMFSTPPQLSTPAFPTPRSTNKRSAEDAFSPTSASFAPVPSKRPVVSVQIPEYRQAIRVDASGDSYSPLESLQAFSRMSIGATMIANGRSPVEEPVRSSHDLTGPQTLVAAYSLESGRKSVVPQNLYYYALSCSPLSDSSPTEQEARARKARLRSHQPAPSTTYSFADLNAPAQGGLYTHTSSTGVQPTLRPPMPSRSSYMPSVVQSATTSPNVGNMASSPQYAIPLPHFRDDVWARPPMPAYAIKDLPTDKTYPTPPDSNDTPMHYSDVAEPRQQQSPVDMVYVPASQTARPIPSPQCTCSDCVPTRPQQLSNAPVSSRAVPSAPFANAGPPGVSGVQFYPTPPVASIPVPPFQYGSRYPYGSVQPQTQYAYCR